jgi:hypothetical protein
MLFINRGASMHGRIAVALAASVKQIAPVVVPDFDMLQCATAPLQRSDQGFGILTTAPLSSSSSAHATPPLRRCENSVMIEM